MLDRSVLGLLVRPRAARPQLHLCGDVTSIAGQPEVTACSQPSRQNRLPAIQMRRFHMNVLTQWTPHLHMGQLGLRWWEFHRADIERADELIQLRHPQR